jgi:hypothetical protein
MSGSSHQFRYRGPAIRFPLGVPQVLDFLGPVGFAQWHYCTKPFLHAVVVIGQILKPMLQAANSLSQIGYLAVLIASRFNDLDGSIQFDFEGSEANPQALVADVRVLVAAAISPDARVADQIVCHLRRLFIGVACSWDEHGEATQAPVSALQRESAGPSACPATFASISHLSALQLFPR